MGDIRTMQQQERRNDGSSRDVEMPDPEREQIRREEEHEPDTKLQTFDEDVNKPASEE